jgi:hypothetical protein
MMKKYLWDYFGPRALGTATHFEIHLKEFLMQNRIEGCTTGLESSGEGHHAVFCLVPELSCSVIERSLRPKRALDVTQ